MSEKGHPPGPPLLLLLPENLQPHSLELIIPFVNANLSIDSHSLTSISANKSPPVEAVHNQNNSVEISRYHLKAEFVDYFYHMMQPTSLLRVEFRLLVRVMAMTLRKVPVKSNED